MPTAAASEIRCAQLRPNCCANAAVCREPNTAVLQEPSLPIETATVYREANRLRPPSADSRYYLTFAVRRESPLSAKKPTAV